VVSHAVPAGSWEVTVVFQFIRDLIALVMEAASTSGTLVNFYQTTWRYNPEDGHLQNTYVYQNNALMHFFTVYCWILGPYVSDMKVNMTAVYGPATIRFIYQK
jgi:hypothetical protein